MRMMDLMELFWNAFWSALNRYWRTGAPRALTGLGLVGGAPLDIAIRATSEGRFVMVVVVGWEVEVEVSKICINVFDLERSSVLRSRAFV